MRIPCPHCGERDAREFVYLGDANARRPDPQAPDALARFVERLGGHLGQVTTIYDVAVQVLRAVTAEAHAETGRDRETVRRQWPKAPPPDLTALDAAAQRGEKQSDRNTGGAHQPSE